MGIVFAGEPLKLKRIGTEQVYFTHNGKTRSITAEGGPVSLKLPAFIDDIAVHIYINP